MRPRAGLDRLGLGPDRLLTFARSPPGLPGSSATVQVTQTWSVSWAGSEGAGGRLADVTRTAHLPVRVVEIQSSATGVLTTSLTQRCRGR